MPLGPAAITAMPPVIAYIGLGANLGDPVGQIGQALSRLAAVEEVEVTAVSTLYRNPPLGPPDQPWYVNAVARVRTRLSAEELFRVLQQLEVGADQGRTLGAPGPGPGLVIVCRGGYPYPRIAGPPS
jgi:2-amino-4-hydroxy-6-hydroxymethyldihydropteridine diphosphokinase